jgi:hypothetical protein
VLAVTVAWALYLCSRFPRFFPWLAPVLLAVGLVSVTALVAAKLIRPYVGGPLRPRLAATGGALGVIAVLLAPTAWSLSTVTQRDVIHAHRPGAGPASPDTASVLSGRLPRVLPTARVDQLAAFFRANGHREKYTFAIQWAPQAGPFILDGMTVLPVGGFTAQVPDVSPQQLTDLVARGDLRYAVLDAPGAPGLSRNDYPDYAAWVRRSCVPVPGFDATLYDCSAVSPSASR